MTETTPKRRKSIELKTGQIWYPEDPAKPGRKIVFTSFDAKSPRIRDIVRYHNGIGFLNVDRNGKPTEGQQTFTEDDISWNSWIMIEGFRAWIRKRKASQTSELQTP